MIAWQKKRDLPPPAQKESESKDVFERLVQVGEGTYGKVYKAKNLETGVLVALKQIRMEQEKDGFPVTASREIKLLQSLRHPNVVSLLEIMVSKGHVYMVFEYVDHDLTGLLHHPAVRFTPANLKSLMYQILIGLDYIHSRRVLHRDLKGSNILLSKKGDVKIADFGLARFYQTGRKADYTNRVITQWYKPPELLFGETIYGAEVDMWSAGCIFLELWTRRAIFQGQDEIHQLTTIWEVMGTPSVETWPGLVQLPWYELIKPKAVLPNTLREKYASQVPEAAMQVAERMLEFDPLKRLSAGEALNLDYFQRDEPRPQVPNMLSNLKGDWHEWEAKKARKKRKEEERAQHK
ncbi:Pkinase-domain-containing protein [Atractiella rhizophila]|nr:Pkinase-domain-containing protein [Atractiella rhizophila]